jgi:hypothetical protein
MNNEHNKKLSDAVLDAIEEKGVEPTPRWHFQFTNSVIWAGALVALLVGAISLAPTAHIILHTDYDAYRLASDSGFTFFAMTLPYLWLVLLAIGVSYAVYAARRTKTGYRFMLSKLVLGSVVLGSLVGGGLYAAGGGNAIDSYLLECDCVPLYREMSGFREDVWTTPERGLLAGVVTEVSGNSLTIEDFSGNTWVIDVSAAQVRGKVSLTREEPIKIIGEQTGADTFAAREIRPWTGRGAQLHKHMRAMQRNDMMMRPIEQ